MKRLSSQRIAILVDNQNIYLYCKTMEHIGPDYQYIMDMVGNREVVRALMYNITPDNVDQTRFLNVVEDMGWEIRSKAPHRFPDGSRKEDWDMQIAVDALSIADKVDAIMLVSGDGDFVPLVHALKARGVRVEVASFPGNTSGELTRTADAYLPLRNEAFLRKE